jgi:hypothetical protein
VCVCDAGWVFDDERLITTRLQYEPCGAVVVAGGLYTLNSSEGDAPGDVGVDCSLLGMRPIVSGVAVARAGVGWVGVDIGQALSYAYTPTYRKNVRIDGAKPPARQSFSAISVHPLPLWGPPLMMQIPHITKRF